jgi:hypothetical protein
MTLEHHERQGFTLKLKQAPSGLTLEDAPNGDSDSWSYDDEEPPAKLPKLTTSS